MRLTYPTALVLQALLQGHHHGFDIMDATAAERHRSIPSFAVRPRATCAEVGREDVARVNSARRGATTSSLPPAGPWVPRPHRTAPSRM